MPGHSSPCAAAWRVLNATMAIGDRIIHANPKRSGHLERAHPGSRHRVTSPKTTAPHDHASHRVLSERDPGARDLAGQVGHPAAQQVGCKSTTRCSASRQYTRKHRPETVAMDSMPCFRYTCRTHDARESARGSRSGASWPSARRSGNRRMRREAQDPSAQHFFKAVMTTAPRSTRRRRGSSRISRCRDQGHGAALGDARSIPQIPRILRTSTASFVAQRLGRLGRAACSAGYTVAVNVSTNAAIPILTTSPACTSLGRADM